MKWTAERAMILDVKEGQSEKGANAGKPWCNIEFAEEFGGKHTIRLKDPQQADKFKPFVKKLCSLSGSLSVDVRQFGREAVTQVEMQIDVPILVK